MIWRWARSVGHFWYDFVVGDDWRLAVTVVVGLALTAVAELLGYPAWVVLPVIVLATIVWTTLRVGRPRHDEG